MSGYTSIMVQAYGLATGKTIQESLVDLAIDHLVDPSEINQSSLEINTLASSLSQDACGVGAWGVSREKNY